MTIPSSARHRSRLDDWCDLIRTSFVSLEIRPERDLTFSGSVELHTIGALSAAEVTSVAQDFRRTDSLIRRDDIRLLQVGLLRRGRAVVEQDDRRCRIGAGGIVLYDTTRPFRWSMTEPWALDVFSWPLDLLRLPSTREITARPLPPGPATSVARAALLGVQEDRVDVGGAEGDHLAAVLADLVLCASRPGDAPVLPAAVLAVHRVVDANLRDPALDPALVARLCHTSLRSLHRLFADQPRSLARTIRRRRLEAARTTLRRDPARPVASVAAEFCFSDASVFARAFREEFGCSPRADITSKIRTRGSDVASIAADAALSAPTRP